MKVVVQETGLKPDTLRAWERRYNLPQPERTEGGHRLYSRQDIELLKWLISRQDEGMNISHAVELWNRLLAEGKDPLHKVERPAAERPGAQSAALTTGSTMSQLRQSWIAACLAFDEQSAEAALAQAFAFYPPENVCFELLQKGLSDIGKGWYQGSTTVQQEHFASVLSLRRLEALVAAAPQPTRSERILIGCPPHEEHTFSPLLLTLLLRRRGWPVVYLGANVPVDRLESTIHSTRPEIAVFPAQQLYTAAALLAIASLLDQQKIPLAFGGRIFTHLPGLKDHIPGHYLGEDLDSAVQGIERMIFNPRNGKAVKMPTRFHLQALEQFQQQQAVIESAVWQQLRKQEIPYAHVVNANLHLARNIAAALKLGNMQFLGSEIEWVEGLMDNYGINASFLSAYLNAYYQAAKQHLNDHSRPIIDWLSQFHTSEF
jgi:DNA-binding transcriptional MerR regulator